MERFNAEDNRTVIVHNGDFYWARESDARAALASLPPQFAVSAKVRDYDLGFAVQLHDSGDYLGPGRDPADHECPWCPHVTRERSAELMQALLQGH